MDTFGPITDNAHGIFEMSKLNVKKASDTLAWMDAIGNTTKALTKGLAIATAVIAATALFRSFIDEAGAKLVTNGIAAIQIQLPEIFIGLMIGASVPFLFSSFALKAVGRAAGKKHSGETLNDALTTTTTTLADDDAGRRRRPFRSTLSANSLSR